MKNIILKREGTTIGHRSEMIKEADMGTITFEFQKNDRRNITIHMFRTGDSILCAVVAWGSTVKRLILTIPNANDETTVCSYPDKNGETREVNSTQVRTRIKSTVELIGENNLGFSKDEVGLHSIRSGGVMAMFLSGVSNIIIQRIGRMNDKNLPRNKKGESKNTTTYHGDGEASLDLIYRGRFEV